MSGVSQIQEQNEQTLALLRERLPVQEPTFPESPVTGGEPHEN